MELKDLAALTDQELMAEAKKMKNANIGNAFLIGILMGIVVYSVAKSTWGLVTLLPLYLVYKLINKPTYDKATLEQLLKERNLK